MHAAAKRDESSSPKPPPSTPASRLRAARLSAGLSQFRLAALSGLSLQTVSLCERGANITRATAERLAGVLAVSAEELTR